MKLEFDYIKSVLQQMEDAVAGTITYSFTRPDTMSDQEAMEHIHLLEQSGYLEGKVLQHSGKFLKCTIKRMTMLGHEFLANAKNDTIWKKLKAKAEANGGKMTMTIASALLSKLALKHLNLDD